MPLLVVKQHSSIWNQVKSQLARRQPTVRQSIDADQNNKVFKVYYKSKEWFSVCLFRLESIFCSELTESQSKYSSFRSITCLEWILRELTSTILLSWKFNGSLKFRMCLSQNKVCTDKMTCVLNRPIPSSSTFKQFVKMQVQIVTWITLCWWHSLLPFRLKFHFQSSCF